MFAKQGRVVPSKLDGLEAQAQEVPLAPGALERFFDLTRAAAPDFADGHLGGLNAAVEVRHDELPGLGLRYR